MSFFFSALLASSVFAQTPDPSQTYIQSLSYGGNGCPQGTVAGSLASDLKSFTLIFDNFIASSGPGTSPSDLYKSCQINVNMVYPPGYSYSIVSLDYRGYASLPAGVSATQDAYYYFAGQSTQTKSSSTFTGPYSSDYHARDEIDSSKTSFSPCGEVVPGNIKTSVYLSGNTAQSAQITVDSIDGKVKQTYGFVWRTC